VIFLSTSTAFTPNVAVEWLTNLGFEVLTAASIKMAAFWVAAPCSLLEVVSEVLAASIIRAIVLMMEAARTPEALVNFYQTTRRYNPEDSLLKTCLIFMGSRIQILDRKSANLLTLFSKSPQVNSRIVSLC
jgi:hypothetical protein